MKVCIITSETVGPFSNGGVGTHCANLAAFLSARLGKDAVTLLYTGAIEKEDYAFWRKHYAEKFSVDFQWIDPAQMWEEAPTILGITCLYDISSQAILEFLTRHHYDVCFFQDLLGLGFRSIQAKRMGVGLSKSLLTCMTHSSVRWVNEVMKTQQMYGLSQTLTMYMERYSVENCDLLLSPSEYMIKWCEGDVEKMPDDRRVVFLLSNLRLGEIETRPASNKIIFFGRLEQRKGFILFLKAISIVLRRKKVSVPLEIHLLGKNGFTEDGGAEKSLAKYGEKIKDNARIYSVNDLGHEEVIEYLKAHSDAVVVCPSIIDNSPNTIIEALQLKVNLIACDTGGIPELFGSKNRFRKKRSRLCAPEPGDLAKLLERALNNRLPAVVARYSPDEAVAQWSALLDDLQHAKARVPGGQPIEQMVVVIARREINDQYDRQQAALAEQTFPNFEIVEAACSQDIATLHGSRAIVIIPLDCIPKPDSLTRVAEAMKSSESEVLVAWAEYPRSAGQTLKVRPFGPVMEAAIFGNFFGMGMLAFRPNVAFDCHNVATYLFAQNNAWPQIVRLVVAGKHTLDVIPKELSECKVSWVSMIGSQQTYDEQSVVIDAMTAGLPRWHRRFFEAAAGQEIQMTSERAKRSFAGEAD